MKGPSSKESSSGILIHRLWNLPAGRWDRTPHCFVAHGVSIAKHLRLGPELLDSTHRKEFTSDLWN